MPVPSQYQPVLDQKSDQAAYAWNLMGTADAVNERIITGSYRRIDITKFKEEPNQVEDAPPGAKLLIQEINSINIPDVKPIEFATMYMQRNLPGAMPGCTTMTNGDPSMGGKVISGQQHSTKCVGISKQAWTSCLSILAMILIRW